MSWTLLAALVSLEGSPRTIVLSRATRLLWHDDARENHCRWEFRVLICCIPFQRKEVFWFSSNSLWSGSILPQNYWSITCLRLGCESSCVSVALKLKVLLRLRRLDPTPKFTATCTSKNNNSYPHVSKLRNWESRVLLRAPQLVHTGEPVRSKSAELIFKARLPEKFSPTENSVQKQVEWKADNSESWFPGMQMRVNVRSEAALRPRLPERQLYCAHLSSSPALLHQRWHQQGSPWKRKNIGDPVVNAALIRSFQPRGPAPCSLSLAPRSPLLL